MEIPKREILEPMKSGHYQCYITRIWLRKAMKIASVTTACQPTLWGEKFLFFYNQRNHLLSNTKNAMSTLVLISQGTWWAPLHQSLVFR